MYEYGATRGGMHAKKDVHIGPEYAGGFGEEVKAKANDYDFKPRLDLTTKLLCEMCKKLKKEGNFDSASQEIKDWYVKHLAEDQARLEMELAHIEKQKQNIERRMHDLVDEMDALNQQLENVREEMGEDAYHNYHEKLARKVANVERIKKKIQEKGVI